MNSSLLPLFHSVNLNHILILSDQSSFAAGLHYTRCQSNKPDWDLRLGLASPSDLIPSHVFSLYHVSE